MGTYQVPMELHAHNRVKLLTALRDHLASQQLPLQGFVLLQGGEDQYRYCTDDLVLFWLAELKILEALLKGGILNGDVKQMMERRLGATFMPYGLGHFLGLDTHDPGGYPQGVERSTALGLRLLRTARTLQEGMVITVESRCYFIERLIDEAIMNREIACFINKKEIERFKSFGGVRLEDDIVITVESGCYLIERLIGEAITNTEIACFINKKEIERFKSFGGVRLEDDIVVTINGCENLTKCPREIIDVEVVMVGSPWPPI